MTGHEFEMGAIYGAVVIGFATAACYRQWVPLFYALFFSIGVVISEWLL